LRRGEHGILPRDPQVVALSFVLRRPIGLKSGTESKPGQRSAPSLPDREGNMNLPKIAQRFNAGLRSTKVSEVPSGTTEAWCFSAVLSSLTELKHFGDVIVPALKRRAIFGNTAGDCSREDNVASLRFDS